MAAIGLLLVLGAGCTKGTGGSAPTASAPPTTQSVQDNPHMTPAQKAAAQAAIAQAQHH